MLRNFATMIIYMIFIKCTNKFVEIPNILLIASLSILQRLILESRDIYLPTRQQPWILSILAENFYFFKMSNQPFFIESLSIMIYLFFWRGGGAALSKILCR